MHGGRSDTAANASANSGAFAGKVLRIHLLAIANGFANEVHRVLQGAPPRGRQLYFTLSAPHSVPFWKHPFSP